MQENYTLKRKLNLSISLAVRYSQALQIIKMKGMKKFELILN
jgi:hypothetical protein